MALKVTDLAGFGKGVEKLIDACTQGLGRLANPFFIRGEADAEAYKIRALGAANTDVLKERIAALTQGDATIAVDGDKVAIQLKQDAQLASVVERSQAMATHQNLLHQLNMEAVVAHAAQQLEDEKDVADEPVNPDWLNRLFGHAEQISSDEMQVLWGNILAGEIKQPGSFSLRTLDVLRNLNQHEAQLFQKAASLVLHVDTYYFIYGGVGDQFLNEHGLSYAHILTLADCGLLQPTKGDFQLYAGNQADDVAIHACDLAIVLNGPVSGPSTLTKVYNLTKAAAELCELLKPTANFEYLKGLASALRGKGLTVSYAKILGRTATVMQIDEPLLEFPAE